jgi:hypothetical protein
MPQPLFPGCVEVEVYVVELPLYGVLRSSAKVCSQKAMLAAPESGPRVPWIAKYSDQRSPSR